LKKCLATRNQTTIILNVPLDDDFGDWATPKESKAGHFLRSASCRTIDPMSAGLPLVLNEADAPAEPLRLFADWYAAAIRAQVHEPGAMTLATATPAGVPSARMVLLRGFDEHGLVFYTNYCSRKAAELDANPRAALVLFWSELHRQIRVEGMVEKVTAAESDAYFQGRAHGSQLGALASPQSEVIAGRHVLECRVAELAALYPNDVPRPASWGGYRVAPHLFEFWQGRENRLHDRLRYRRNTDGGWLLERLAP
jgi:pyridoxamine 5'-phosphate oxidase